MSNSSRPSSFRWGRPYSRAEQSLGARARPAFDRWLRVDQIRSLIGLIEDSGISRLELLGRTQAMVLGAPEGSVPDYPLVAELLVRHDWPDSPSDARTLLNKTLSDLEGMGLSVGADVVHGYARAADQVAQQDLGTVLDAESLEQAVLAVAAGVRAYGRLLLSLVALAQASQSIGRLGSVVVE